MEDQQNVIRRELGNECNWFPTYWRWWMVPCEVASRPIEFFASLEHLIDDTSRPQHSIFFLSWHEIFRSKQRVSIRAWVLGIGSQRFDIFFKWPFNVSSLICPIQMLVEILFRFTYLCEYHLSRLSGLRMCFIHGTNLSSCIYSCLLLLYFIETLYLNSVKSFTIFSNVFKINVAYKTRYITIILQNISKKFTNSGCEWHFTWKQVHDFLIFRNGCVDQ